MTIRLIVWIVAIVLTAVGPARTATAPSPSWTQIGLPPAQFTVLDSKRNRLLLFDERQGQISATAMSLADSSWAPIVTDGAWRSSEDFQWAMFDSLGDRALLVFRGSPPTGGIVELAFTGQPVWRSLAQGPSATHPAFAFDSKRRRILWFGGHVQGGSSGGTFLNSLTSFAIDSLAPPRGLQCSPLPTARSRSTLVYDSARDRLILCGGGSAGQQMAVEHCPLSEPLGWYAIATGPPQIDQQAIYDPIGDRVLFFGDASETRGLQSLPLGDLRPPAPIGPAPPSRSKANLVYDPVGGRLIVTGGTVVGPLRIMRSMNDVWALSLRGTSYWSDLGPGSLSPPLSPLQWQAVHDFARDRTLVAMWTADSTCELWRLDPRGRWSSSAVRGVPRLVNAGITIDRRRDRLLLFGDPDLGGGQSLLWEVGLTEPAEVERVQTSGPLPEIRYELSAAYDSVGDRMFVFGHENLEAPQAWSAWVLERGVVPPRWRRTVPFPGRWGGAVSYDVLRDRWIVSSYDGTWALDRADAWTLLAAAGPPPGYGRTCDALRDELIVVDSGDLWQLDLGDRFPWAQATSHEWPSDTRQVVYDPRRDRWVAPGPRASVLPMPCPAVTSRSILLPDATFAQVYRATFDLNLTKPSPIFRWVSGTSPLGILVGPALGVVSGTPQQTGWHRWVIAAEDGAGCVSLHEMSLFVRPCLQVSADVACVRGGATARISCGIARSDTFAIRTWRAVLQLPPELELAEPCTIEGCPSVRLGTFFADVAAPATLRVLSVSPGTFEITCSVTGASCGSRLQAASWFTVDVRPAGVDGPGAVAIDTAAIETCSGQTGALANCGSPARVSVDRSGPPAIEDLNSAASETHDHDGTRPVRLAFTPPPDAARVEVYRAGFGNPPEYDDLVLPDSTSGRSPSTPSYPPGPPWTLTAASRASPIDETPIRDVYSYVAFCFDACGNVSAVSNLAAGAPNYRLGDFTGAAAACHGDNAVGDIDLTRLRDHYGEILADPGPDPRSCLDIGPTATGGVTGRPLTDNRIDFEDLVILALDYDAPPLALPAAGSLRAGLVVPPLPPIGETFETAIDVASSGDVRAVHLRLAYDESILERLDVSGGRLLGRQRGQPFVAASPSHGIDVAVCGGLLNGVGEVARVRFRVLRDGDPGLRLSGIDARNTLNQPVEVETTAVAHPTLTTVTALSPAYPNPAQGTVAFRVVLATLGPARLGVYDLLGRRVRDLVVGHEESGETTAVWDGRDGDGERQPAGVYLARLYGLGRTITRRFVFVP